MMVMLMTLVSKCDSEAQVFGSLSHALSCQLEWSPIRHANMDALFPCSAMPDTDAHV